MTRAGDYESDTPHKLFLTIVLVRKLNSKDEKLSRVSGGSRIQEVLQGIKRYFFGPMRSKMEIVLELYHRYAAK